MVGLIAKGHVHIIIAFIHLLYYYPHNDVIRCMTLKNYAYPFRYS